MDALGFCAALLSFALFVSLIWRVEKIHSAAERTARACEKLASAMDASSQGRSRG
jgi:F0F1-type ATP synthase assembly protein I